MRRKKFSFRLSEIEIEKLKYLTRLFYLLNYIPKLSMSDALRFMIDNMMEEVEYREKIKKLKKYYTNFLNKF